MPLVLACKEGATLTSWDGRCQWNDQEWVNIESSGSSEHTHPLSDHTHDGSTGSTTGTYTVIGEGTGVVYDGVEFKLDPTFYAITFVGFFTLVGTFHVIGFAIRNVLKKLN